MIRRAEPPDIPALVGLINEAYQVESPFMQGARIDEAGVAKLFNAPDSAFLLHEAKSTLAGAVYVHWRDDRGFFGPLAVRPALQVSGIGKALIAAAEEICRANGARHLDLDVLSFRPELLTYYERLGFSRNGTEPYPHPERLRVPAELILMTRPIHPAGS
jgi:GNAT superfamily N-acetyltransferase